MDRGWLEIAGRSDGRQHYLRQTEIVKAGLGSARGVLKVGGVLKVRWGSGFQKDLYSLNSPGQGRNAAHPTEPEWHFPT